MFAGIENQWKGPICQRTGYQLGGLLKESTRGLLDIIYQELDVKSSECFMVTAVERILNTIPSIEVGDSLP